MKFGQKIFLLSFILIIITINSIGIIMINNTYKVNMEKEIEKGLLQINNIKRGIENNVGDLSYVANMYLKNKVNIEIYSSGKRTYTNLKEEDSIIAQEKLFTKEEMTEDEYEKLKGQYESEGKFVESYIQDNKLFMKMNYRNVIILTLTDISEINEMKEEQTEFFIKLSFISSFLIALILSVSVNFLTRKIKVLNKAVEKVQEGDYSVKIKKLGNDEIGNFGKSFEHMTESIQKNISQIQEVSENRKKFIGNLTHEIRTPLTSVIGYSSLIKNKKITDEKIILEYANRIHEEGKYIEKMSENLMDMFLYEKGNIKLEEINISKELTKIIEELKQEFQEVKYEQEIAPNIYLKTDKILLKSLILNLVKNAIHAYEKEPFIRIELNEKKEIRVIDYGKGIPKEELEKIKEPFYTLNKNRNRKLSGMGLGLALCMKIVKIHKGKLEIESKENIGTTVIIKLGEENEE